MKRTAVWTGLMLILCSTPTFAKTLLTEKNLDAYIQMLHEMDAMNPDEGSFDEQDAAYDEGAEPRVTFAPHCDWKRHYQQQAESESAESVAQLEKMTQRHGFTPAEFFELSNKIQWISMEEAQALLKSTEAMLQKMPAGNRAELETQVANQHQVMALLNRCMTDEDKKAAKHLKPLMMQKFMQEMDN